MTACASYAFTAAAVATTVSAVVAIIAANFRSPYFPFPILPVTLL